MDVSEYPLDRPRKQANIRCELVVKLSIVIAMLSLSGGSIIADEPQVIELWPDGVPGLATDDKPEIIVENDARIGQKVTKVSKPVLTVYRPAEQKSDAAMIICPGGGYHILALDLEGTEIAKWLNDLGLTAMVLQYRVPTAQDDQQHELPLMDAQRAISLVRDRAQEWDLNPNRIGIMGFSAGGHLAVNAATNFATRAYEATDTADQVSCRPDFFMLVYPAYLVKKDTDKKDTVALVEDLPVSEKTPPALLIHAANDSVSCNSSVAMFLALNQAKVPAELHVYPEGGHGYGLRPSTFAVSSWPDRGARWLQGLGLFSSK